MINGTGQVSPVTQQAVLRAIEEMGGIKLRRRRSRSRDPLGATSRSGLVEVVMHLISPIEHISIANGQIAIGPIAHCPPEKFFRPENRFCNTHFRRIIDGAMDELNRVRLRPVLRTTDNLKDGQLLADISHPDLQGIILIGNDGPEVDAFLRRCSCPTVSFIGGGRNGQPYVASDDLPGMRQAIAHLKELGHRRIAYIACPRKLPGFLDRLNAFLVAMVEHGLEIRRPWIFEDSIHVHDIMAAVEQMLKGSSRPTAIMCSYDAAALGAIRAAENCGMSVPRDLSVIGFGNQDICEFVRPALTTVEVPTYEMGRAAVNLLQLRRINGEMAAGMSIRLPTRLVQRSSTGKPGGERRSYVLVNSETGG